MNTLIISDTHLSHDFEEKKYEFLLNLIQEADRVIINGDFWDGYICTFDAFIHSPWKALFPFLKAKRTIYLYGNHDKKNFSDQRVSLFCELATLQYKFVMNDQVYFVEHGNRFHPGFDEVWNITGQYPILMWWNHQLNRFLLKTFKSTLIKFYYEKDNLKIKRKLRHRFIQGEILICGHTHAAEIDSQARFLNSGMINYGLGQYLTIQNEKITLHQKWYE